MNRKNYFVALILAVSILSSVNLASAAVNQTLKDQLLPFVDIKYDYANGTIDEVMIYNRSLGADEISAIYSAAPQAKGETWNCTINATDSSGLAGNPSSTTRFISNITTLEYSVSFGSIIKWRCSPDNETFPNAPMNQTNTFGIINTTNNGTDTNNIQIRYTGTPGTNWSFYVANQSSITTNNITLSNSFQTVWGNVLINQIKYIWLWANCSFTGQRPGITIELQPKEAF